MEIALYNRFSGEELSSLVRTEGPETAFNFLYKQFDARMLRKFTRILNIEKCFDPRSHGEDVRQESWLAINKHLNDYYLGNKDEGYRHPYNFVYTIWLRKSNRHLRRETGKIVQFPDEGDGPVLSEAAQSLWIPEDFYDLQLQLEREDLCTIVSKLLGQSPVEIRLIIEMRLNGWTYIEIGKKLGISEANARKKYSRIVHRLRKILPKAGGKK